MSNRSVKPSRAGNQARPGCHQGGCLSATSKRRCQLRLPFFFRGRCEGATERGSGHHCRAGCGWGLSRGAPLEQRGKTGPLCFCCFRGWRLFAPLSSRLCSKKRPPATAQTARGGTLPMRLTMMRLLVATVVAVGAAGTCCGTCCPAGTCCLSVRALSQEGSRRSGPCRAGKRGRCRGGLGGGEERRG